MTEPLDRLHRNYRVAFLRFLPGRSEDALNAGYGLGREALTAGIGAIDIVRIHHSVLGEILAAELRDSAGRDKSQAVLHLMERSADFLSEVLAAADMAQRAVLNGNREDH
ncbi:phosphatase RsbU N-terminal domain-containing protein [Ammonicoccus fulvus]|uniref:Phosphatase RsbU N-terminal domain-containing protein n=1 Tax=Ammonicoccus fulvus TaxID=3138240 RepID=A0ABZ3FRX5_9ACTN